MNNCKYKYFNLYHNNDESENGEACEKTWLILLTGHAGVKIEIITTKLLFKCWMSFTPILILSTVWLHFKGYSAHSGYPNLTICTLVGLFQWESKSSTNKFKKIFTYGRQCT